MSDRKRISQLPECVDVDFNEDLILVVDTSDKTESDGGTSKKATARHFKGEKGEQGVQGTPGEIGPANTLSIGSVSSGSEASATIVGASPNQTLNLVLPRGEQGIPGIQGERGERGERGLAGPSNTLVIGAVTSGETASATITGTSPNQTLNLVLPKGEKGNDGEQGLPGANGRDGVDGVGVPTGGATGQVLRKKTNTNYDTEWGDVTGGVSSVNNQTGEVVLEKSDIGLSEVDNTSDANKPVSIAQADAISAKYTKPASGIPKADLESTVRTSLNKADTALQSFTETDPTVPAWAKENTKPAYTKGEVGLGNVDNTSDLNKPVSTAVQTALNGKQDTLVSGVNIKSLNGETLLGEGDITIAGGSDSPIIKETITVPTAYNIAAKIGTSESGNYVPSDKDIIRVGFVNGSVVSSPTLKIDGRTAYPIILGSKAATTATLNLGTTTNSNISILLWFNAIKNAWMMFGPTTNSTYSEITTAEIDAGTATSNRVITGRRVKYIMDKAKDSTLSELRIPIYAEQNTTTSFSLRKIVRIDYSELTPDGYLVKNNYEDEYPKVVVVSVDPTSNGKKGFAIASGEVTFTLDTAEAVPSVGDKVYASAGNYPRISFDSNEESIGIVKEVDEANRKVTVEIGFLDLGRCSLRRSIWSTGKTYLPNDVLFGRERIQVCIKKHVSSDTSFNDGDFWKIYDIGNNFEFQENFFGIRLGKRNFFLNMTGDYHPTSILIGVSKEGENASFSGTGGVYFGLCGENTMGDPDTSTFISLQKIADINDLNSWLETLRYINIENYILNHSQVRGMRYFCIKIDDTVVCNNTDILGYVYYSGKPISFMSA